MISKNLHITLILNVQANLLKLFDLSVGRNLIIYFTYLFLEDETKSLVN